MVSDDIRIAAPGCFGSAFGFDLETECCRTCSVKMECAPVAAEAKVKVAEILRLEEVKTLSTERPKPPRPKFYPPDPDTFSPATDPELSKLLMEEVPSAVEPPAEEVSEELEPAGPEVPSSPKPSDTKSASTAWTDELYAAIVGELRALVDEIAVDPARRYDKHRRKYVALNVRLNRAAAADPRYVFAPAFRPRLRLGQNILVTESQRRIGTDQQIIDLDWGRWRGWQPKTKALRDLFIERNPAHLQVMASKKWRPAAKIAAAGIADRPGEQIMTIMLVTKEQAIWRLRLVARRDRLAKDIESRAKVDKHLGQLRGRGLELSAVWAAREIERRLHPDAKPSPGNMLTWYRALTGDHTKDRYGLYRALSVIDGKGFGGAVHPASTHRTKADE